MELAIDFTYKPTAGGYIQFEKILEFLPPHYKRIDIYFRAQESEIIEKLVNDKANVTLNKLDLPKNALIRFIWHQIFFPFILSKKKVDVLFCPGNIIPVFYMGRKVVWVGTIGQFFFKFFKDFPLRRKIEMFVSRYIMALSGKFSILSFHESEFSRSIYLDRYRISKLETAVINIGKDEYFFQVKGNDLKDYLKKKFQISGDFVFYASHVHPYKNFDRLLEVYGNICINNHSTPPLLIAGRTTLHYGGQLYYEQLMRMIDKLNISNKIIFLGNVTREDLKFLYSGCKLFLFPSLFESISYTLMEAMACGAPIVASNVTAIPEACGYAASYFDPYDITDMEDKIENLLFNEDLLKKYSQFSLKRIKELPDFREVNRITYKLIEKQLTNLK